MTLTPELALAFFGVCFSAALLIAVPAWVGLVVLAVAYRPSVTIHNENVSGVPEGYETTTYRYGDGGIDGDGDIPIEPDGEPLIPSGQRWESN